MPKLKETMTSQELADYWGVTRNSIRQAAFQGRIPGCHKAPNGHLLFDPEEALEWRPAAIVKWEKRVMNPSLSGLRSAREEAERRIQTLTEVVTTQDWTDIIVKAVSQARDGEWRARQWLSNYLIGRPIQRVAAEIDVVTRRSFEASERAAAVEALLASVQERAEGQIVDVTPREIEESDPGRPIDTADTH